MSIEKKAAHGVAWNMATGVLTRIIGLVGTLVLTHFIAPSEYGEVSAAVICVQTANILVAFAFGQYIIANKSPARVVSQAAVVHFALGAVAMVSVYLLRAPLGGLLDAPALGRFVPGFAVSILIDRGRLMAERLLVRDLRFRTVAIINSLGELTFTATALAIAPKYGGYGIMFGAVARSTVTFVAFVAKAPRPEWLVWSPIEGGVMKKLFAYGTPLLLANLADRAAATWDNLIMLRLFGTKIMGAYALSYSLAETPLIYVAERMSDVLMPAFAKMPPAERPAAVVRAAGLMSLVVAPLGVGLGAVAPTIVHAFFDQRWSEMATILTVLSVMTVFQPAPWSALAYLQAESRTRPLMVMSFARAIILLSLVAILGKLGGPIWGAAGVGFGYASYSVAMVIITARALPLPVKAYFVNVVRPLLACAPMYLAVAGVRHVLLAAHVPTGVILALEVVVGGIVYVGGAFVLARSNVRELLALVRGRGR